MIISLKYCIQTISGVSDFFSLERSKQISGTGSSHGGVLVSVNGPVVLGPNFGDVDKPKEDCTVCHETIPAKEGVPDV